MPPKIKKADASTQTDDPDMMPPGQCVLVIQSSIANAEDMLSKSRKRNTHYDGPDHEYFMTLPRKKRQELLSEERRIQRANIPTVPLRFRILSSQMPDSAKASMLRKIDALSQMDPSHGEYQKLNQQLQAASRIPLGIHKQTYGGDQPIKRYLENVRNNLDTAVFGHNECKDQVVRLLAQWAKNPGSQGMVIGIEGPMGCGKCHARDTPILMYDGTIKKVQDVVKGDILMGDDNYGRTVLSTAYGKDALFDIVYINQGDEYYTVNSEHILCLLSKENQCVHEVSVQEYLNMDHHAKQKYLGIRAPHPVAFLKHQSDPSYDIHDISRRVLTGKCVPWDCLQASIGYRQKLLAAIIDGFGTTSIHSLADDCIQSLCFLVRSLGFTSFVYGDALEIVMQSHEDICAIDVRFREFGDYYGFTLDGNNRYMLGDFTVTHNTTLVKNGICKSLGLPFGFVPLGGISDGSFLIGHSYTYEGSRWGRIVDILMSCGVMNPILFFDELDKVSNTYHGEEIKNILIHLTDSTQNTDFHDKYFSDLSLDVSRALMIFSFNDRTVIDPILLDRMVVIKTQGYTTKEKVSIVKQHLLQEVCEKYGLKTDDIVMSEAVIRSIISRSEEEQGVRNLKRSLDNIVSQLNLDHLLSTRVTFPYLVTEEDVEKLVQVKKKDINPSTSMMYI